MSWGVASGGLGGCNIFGLGWGLSGAKGVFGAGSCECWLCPKGLCNPKGEPTLPVAGIPGNAGIGWEANIGPPPKAEGREPGVWPSDADAPGTRPLAAALSGLSSLRSLSKSSAVFGL